MYKDLESITIFISTDAIKTKLKRMMIWVNLYCTVLDIHFFSSNEV